MFTPNEGDITPNGSPLSKKSEKIKKPRNSWGRLYEPEKVAHVLVTQNTTSITCSQYKIEGDDRLYRPIILEELSQHEKNITTTPNTPPSIQMGGCNFLARTPNGTVMTAERSCEIDDKTLLFFSPDRDMTESQERVHKITPKLSVKRKLQYTMADDHSNENKENIVPNNQSNESGEYILYLRDSKINRKKIKSQCQVMGKNARQELIDYIEKNNQYSKKYKELLTLLINSFKVEWLHALAVSLAPPGFDPQQKTNLGASGAWINSLMMPLERLASYFSIKYPGMVAVKPHFTMLPNSEIIDTIHYAITIKKEDKICTVSNFIKALELPNRTNWPSTTDGPQLIQVVEAQLNDIAPAVVTIVNKCPGKKP